MRICCKICDRTPDEIDYYIDQAKSESNDKRTYTPDDIAREDGTYNPRTGHFYCFQCYIKIGMPLGKA